MTLAYNSDPTLKTRMLEIVTAHEAADEIAQGAYWKENGKLRTCAVGCTLHSYAVASGRTLKNYEQHALYEEILGNGGQILARLEDRIFEGLTVEDCKTWPRRFLEAARPGADLSKVWPRFAVWLLTEELAQHTKKYQRVAEAVQSIVDLYCRQIAGEIVDREEWFRARDAAYAAATYAADAAAYAATDAAAYAATDATDAFKRMADKLVELMVAC